TANGWHALFHLLPGVAGVVAAWRSRSAIAFLFIAGGLYMGVAAWGLIAGTDSAGVIAVDTSGDLVHLTEGLVTLALGIWTLRLQRGRGAKLSCVSVRRALDVHPRRLKAVE